MNFGRLAKVLGFLTLLVGVLMLLVSAYGFVEWRRHPDISGNLAAFRSLGVSSVITLVAGCLLLACGWGVSNEFLRREALAIVGLSWFLTALFGAMPYYLFEPGEGPGLGVAESFFESMSGFTTTGATIMKDIEAFPRAILLWRSVSQYLGGIGILVLFVSVLSFLGVGGRRSMMAQESSLNISESRASKIGQTAFGLLGVYLVLSVVCFIGLVALGMPVFDSVCHTFTAISTAGFSPKNDSIGHYDHLGIEIWIACFMLLGSVSFLLYILIVKRNKDERDVKRIRREEEGKFYLIIVLIAVIAVALDLEVEGWGAFLACLRECFFMVISVSTTTGFGNTDYDEWSTFSKIVLWVLMVMGGCAGSTAGGLKMNRMLLLKRLVTQELIQSFRPHQVFKIKLNGVAPDQRVMVQTSMFISIAIVIFGFSLILVSLIEPHLDFESVIGAVTGCLFNIGPGFGEVGPTDTYADLNRSTMVFLSILMAMGRLEFFAVLVLFIPSLWKKY